MPTAELTRRNGVELARVGVWPAATGPWTASPGDFAAAIAATACPAVRRPYVRIGHFDGRFQSDITDAAASGVGDGEPALGWVENLRLTDGGSSLVGDLVGMPSWLDTVLASAYPDRSVEGAYGRRCQLGHHHPFVLDGVALLGVTRPGVGTLKPIGGLDDVRALFEPVAASAGEVRIAASIPGAAIAAAAVQHTGAMIALIPTDADARRLAVDGGEPADELHVTLMYLGDAAEIPTKVRARIVDAVSRAINAYPPAEADSFAVSMFNPRGDEPCVVLGVSGEMASDVHVLVEAAVRGVAAGTALDLPKQHEPWIPHVTLQYTGDAARVASLTDRTGPIVFDRVRVVFAGDATDIPLTAVGWDDNDWNATQLNESGWDAEMVAAAGGNADHNALKRYWTKDPRGLAKWIKSPHPWRALYRHLKKFMNDDMAKRVTSQWYHDVLHKWPGSKDGSGTKAAASPDTGGHMPNPQPSHADVVRSAWNAKAPFSQHLHLIRAGEAIVLDESDRSFWRVPVSVDGDTVVFGELARVMPDFVDFNADLVAASVVFASRTESRPDAPPDPRPPAEPVPPAGPPPTTEDAPPTTPPDPGGVLVSPANAPGAEPEITDPMKGADPVSTLSTDVRSRLGLPDDADEAAVLAALDERLSKPTEPNPPTEPAPADPAPVPAPTEPAREPELVAAAAAKENTELRKEVQVLASQVTAMSAKLAATEAEKAATVKASVLDDAQRLGKFTPAERGQWDKDYDDAPAVTTRLLGRIAAGAAVPVTASGYTGADEVPDPDALIDSEVSAWAKQLGISAEELTR